MNKVLTISIKTLTFCLLSMLIFSSCAPKVQAVYFTDIDSLKIKQVMGATFTEPLIQTDDILSITVQTIDPAASMAVNQTPAAAAPASAGAGLAISGFLVDKKGNVEIPMLGIVKLAGLTTAAAKEVIRTEALKYYKDPTIQVRFANYKITVLGEVAKPSSYTVPNEKVSILDAIAMAGDVTIYGKRNNVLLIRETDGKKDVVRLDLTQSAVLSSPYFYLKQNDVLYVEPGKGKIAANNAAQRQTLTILVSSLSVLIALITRL
ncbi:polysaccharide biosynthesis/export family protein [Pedobacter sp. MR2016-24]|uniref:polysaccharide biosynthesis/export family protein n=1 Tax=Pedobacter sp. MR2016-24 TaxID=2994466 RepID=UPI002247787F|nr:polysaccharide biosynthesis/export family protein [Pedobacter sp. MR2016-24]MCX2485277.1 polysaccharide biosynthesis/export family protein [Pedobacter sp. MR2016-24]